MTSPESLVHLLVLASGDSGLVSIRLGKACGRSSAVLLKGAFVILRKAVAMAWGCDSNWEKGAFLAHTGRPGLVFILDHLAG